MGPTRRGLRESAARAAFIAGACALSSLGCTETFPEELEGYRERCLEFTAEPLPPRSDDPHEGFKRVYACGVTREELVDADGAPRFPFPDGATIIKEAWLPEQEWIWLVATAEKADGAWKWREYTRNFDNEPLLQILAPESKCTGCHDDAAATDYIFTIFQN
jgi:hypothetical protein